MTKMAAMPIMVKTLQLAQWNNFNETWYVASGTTAQA